MLIGTAIGLGLLLMIALQSANIERMMRPERFAEESWAATLFATSWASGALAVAIGTGATGWASRTGAGGPLLAMVTLGAFTWGARLMVRQALQERKRAVALLPPTEEGTDRNKAAMELVISERKRLQRIWEGDATLKRVWTLNRRMVAAVASTGSIAGILSGVLWNTGPRTAIIEIETAITIGGSIGLCWACEQKTRPSENFSSLRRRLEDQHVFGSRCKQCGNTPADGVDLHAWKDDHNKVHVYCTECRPPPA